MKKVLISLVVMISLVFAASLSFAGFDLGETNLSSDSGMDLHGYYEFEYWDTQGKRETFDAHKVTIWMGKAVVPDKVYISAEFEWEHFPRHADDGSSEPGGDGEIKLDSVQVSFTPNNTCRAYAGVFYVPFGLEFESYPGHKNKLITRPKAFKSNNIIKGTWSDVGIGLEHKADGIGKLDIYVVNGDAHNGGISRDSSNGGNSSKSAGARISLDGIAKGLNVGASYVSGRYSADGAAKDLDSTRTAFHLKADLSELAGLPMGLQLLAEHVVGKDEDDSAAAGSPDRKVEGSYFQLSFIPMENLEVAVRHDIYDNDTKVTDNGKTATSIGVGYSLYEHVKLKAEFQSNEQEADPGAKDDVSVVGVVVDW